MDTLYIGDIPLDYHYAEIQENGDIKLWNKNYFEPNSQARVYLIKKNIQNKFFYQTWTEQYGDTTTYIPLDINVSHKWYDRPDMLNILGLFCCVAVITLWLTNLFTSIFKKGGILSGLF